MKTITIAEKITAQKKLAASLGIDEARWDSMTQTELNAWWDSHCSQYVLTYVEGQGATYIPFANLTTKGTKQ